MGLIGKQNKNTKRYANNKYALIAMMVSRQVFWSHMVSM